MDFGDIRLVTVIKWLGGGYQKDSFERKCAEFDCE